MIASVRNVKIHGGNFLIKTRDVVDAIWCHMFFTFILLNHFFPTVTLLYKQFLIS